jgi:hypothetical protein
MQMLKQHILLGICRKLRSAKCVRGMDKVNCEQLEVSSKEMADINAMDLNRDNTGGEVSKGPSKRLFIKQTNRYLITRHTL